MTRFRSSKTWVMPSLVPRIPLICLSDMGLVTLRPTWVQLCRAQRLLDVDVDARRQINAHERVHRLGRRVENVDQTLVRAHLEVLARVLVLVWRADDAVDVLLGWQRHRPDDPSAGARHGL